MWWLLAALAAAAVGAVQVWRWRQWQEAMKAAKDTQQALADARQQHHEALFQSRAQMQTLFNSMVEGVVLLDPGGRIQLVNQSLERQFSILLDVRGLTVMEALGRPELALLVERLLQTPSAVTVELELDGSQRRRLQVNAASILDREARPQGAIFVIHDLTRLRQLEEIRREFVADVSHELRTPLSLIKGYAETLRTGAAEDPEVAAKFLRKIEHHTDRLNNLIEDLLTISRLESGQVNLKLEEVDLSPLAFQVAEELQPRARAKSAAIHNAIPSGLRVRADRDRLQQVLVNLLDNAIKYGKAGGRITLGAQGSAGKSIQVWVSDDGPGIPPEARGRLFERFYRVDKARSRETGGTGLGLSIVKHIVQSHGGEVWVESDPGQGATFFFTLPQAQTA
jgi:two-component system, OmpR family, phosphate regulon sensor histidine kinase PhoR